MTDYGILINDRAGLPIVDNSAVMIKLHAEGVVTAVEGVSLDVPGLTTINFAPCIPLPMITLIDIDSRTLTFFEDYTTYSNLLSQNGNNQWYRFQIVSYAPSAIKFRYRVWIRDDF